MKPFERNLQLQSKIRARNFHIAILLFLVGALSLFSFTQYQKTAQIKRENILIEIESKQLNVDLRLKVSDQGNQIAELYHSNQGYKAEKILLNKKIDSLDLSIDSIKLVLTDRIKLLQDSIHSLKKEYIHGYRDGESHAYDIQSKVLFQKEQQRQTSLQQIKTNQSSAFRFPSNTKLGAIIHTLGPKKERDNIEVIFFTLMLLPILLISVKISLSMFCQFIDKHRY